MAVLIVNNQVVRAGLSEIKVGHLDFGEPAPTVRFIDRLKYKRGVSLARSKV